MSERIGLEITLRRSDVARFAELTCPDYDGDDPSRWWEELTAEHDCAVTLSQPEMSCTWEKGIRKAAKEGIPFYGHGTGTSESDPFALASQGKEVLIVPVDGDDNAIVPWDYRRGRPAEGADKAVANVRRFATLYAGAYEEVNCGSFGRTPKKRK